MGASGARFPAPPPPDVVARLESIELDLLIEGLYRLYGYDFRHYARASLRRRLLTFMQFEGLESLSAVQARALHEQPFAERLLRAITVTYTGMFRDPTLFRILRGEVLSHLESYPFLRIWQAGVATGEEVYSLAIVLRERGLLERSRIYATDINAESLQQAKKGVYPIDRMQAYTRAYYEAGGSGHFADYYKARYGHAVFDPQLRERITFAQHNLASDASFNVFHLLVCRNVMIYFDAELGRRVHRLLYESLEQHGVLVLGDKESLRGSPFAERFEVIDETWSVYRKIA